MSFLDNYEPVADRLHRFWSDHPAGRVLTEMMPASRETPTVITFRATVWFDKADSVSDATGWASETITDKGVNATSALENCETSAIGRALANCNYAPKLARPSREEMRKVLPAHTADQRLAAELFTMNIGKASTTEELDMIGKSVAAASREGAISRTQLDTLVVAGRSRRAELVGEVSVE